jgi:hypothetical protein
MLCAGALTASGGTAQYDFNSDPTGLFTIYTFGGGGGGYWRATGGVTNSGYLSITDAVNSQGASIIFNDFDSGAVVKDFVFSADVRIGGGTDSPADGFSINYAREGDPLLTRGDGQGYALSPSGEGGDTGLPEEGTRTGVAVCFDEWFSGDPDIIGVTVRVDNQIVYNRSYPLLNLDPGWPAGPSHPNWFISLQTGPAASGGGILTPEFDLTNHVWTSVKVQLTNGLLSVWFKEQQLLTNFVITNFYPSRARLVLGGRTGGSNGHHHVDNIEVTTYPANTPLLTSLSGYAGGFKAVITDSLTALVNPTTVRAELNSVYVPTTATKAGSDTTVRYAVLVPFFLPPNSTNSVYLEFQDFNGVPYALTDTFVVGPYGTVNPSFQNDLVDTNAAIGFFGNMHQIAVTRFPGDENWFQNAERQFWNGYINPASGLPYDNLQESALGPGAPLPIQAIINWGDGAAAYGNFQTPNYPDALIPGNGGDNIVAGILCYARLAAGAYRWGVNSDDGFRVTVGRNPRDVLGDQLGIFDGGRGASDTLFDFVVPVAGVYPFRLLWWEGGGAANVEFFAVNIDTGEKVLLNDPNAQATNAAMYTQVYYEDNFTGNYPYAWKAIPLPNLTGVLPNTPIDVQLKDGNSISGVTIVESSVSMTLDGVPVSPTVTRDGNNVSVVLPSSSLLAGGRHVVTLSYRDTTPFTNQHSWQFFVTTNYAVLPTDGMCPVTVSGAPGFRWLTYQLGFLTTGTLNDLQNLNSQAEDVLDGLFGSLSYGNGSNIASLEWKAADGTTVIGTANPDRYFSIPGVINFNNDAGDIGNFGSDVKIPGIPGLTGLPGVTSGSANDLAAECLTYVKFPKAGFYTMGVNSDDGFRVTAGLQRPRNVLNILSPSVEAGPVGCVPGTAENGGLIPVPLPATPIVGELVVADPVLAGTPLVNAAAVSNKICIVDRGGGIAFSVKINYAQAAGAIAVIVVNQSQPDSFPVIMGGTGTGITIPAVMIGKPDGDRLKAAVASGTVVASMGALDGVQIGTFNGGRGASDTLFNMYVPMPGLYPMRLLYYQGNGGANVEWFAIDEATDTKVLLNDLSQPRALRTYRGAGCLSITAVGADARIEFSGTLQSADVLVGDGPPTVWTDVVGATSPYVIPLSSAAQKFFRSRP